MATLNEAVKEYLDKGMPLEMLRLYIPMEFESDTLFEAADFDATDESYDEYISTMHGHIKVSRTKIVEFPVLVDTANTLTINDDKITYK